MATASARSPDSGFSQNTGIPASTPALISSVWALVAAAMTIASTPLLIRLSGESAASRADPLRDRLGDCGDGIGDHQGVDRGKLGQGVGME